MSAANLKAAAAGLGIPLYRHIGGDEARVMPAPGVITFLGGDRYGGGDGQATSRVTLCLHTGSIASRRRRMTAGRRERS